MAVDGLHDVDTLVGNVRLDGLTRGDVEGAHGDATDVDDAYGGALSQRGTDDDAVLT